MSLPETLERAASALPQHADAIRPANGDPFQLLQSLDADAAARVLGWLFANEPEGAEELALAWAGEEGGEAPLQRLSEADLPKAGRKALRRVMHRLRSRGIEVAGGTAREPAVARLPRIEDAFEMAAVSSVDPGGSLLAYVVEPSESGGARMFEALVSEIRGIEDFQVYNVSRSKARGFLRQVQQSKASAVEARPAGVRALIGRIGDRQPSDRGLPRAFPNWRARLVAGADEAAVPGEEVRAALPTEAEPGRLRAAAERVHDGTWGPWPAPIERLSELAGKLRERAEGRLVLSEAQERQKLDDAVRDTAAELFDEDYAAVTARRFLHSAYVLWKHKKEEDARIAVAAAVAFETLPAVDNPVAAAFLEVALGPLMKSLRESEAGEAEGAAEDASPLVES